MYTKTKENLELIEQIYLEEKKGPQKGLWTRIAVRLNDEFDEDKTVSYWKNHKYRNIKTITSSGSDGKSMSNVERELNDILAKKEDLSILDAVDGTLIARVPATTNPANMSPTELAVMFDVDLEIWKFESFVAKSWNTTMKGDDEDQPVIMTRNYSVAAKWKRKATFDVVTEDDIISLYQKLMTSPPVVDVYDYVKNNPSFDGSNNTLVLGIVDAHIGKLAHNSESDDRYNIKKGISMYEAIAQQLIQRSLAVGFKKIVIPVGNDFFQFDKDSETTKGTRVDSDSRGPKLFDEGTELLARVIEYASQFAPVEVILVRGNHDFNMSFYAYRFLYAWFRKNKNVKVHRSIKARTYMRFGLTLVGFTHGEKEQKRLFKIMHQEARKLWGLTLYAEWVTGHGHHEEVEEEPGIKRRMLPAMSLQDAFEREMAYNSLSASQALIYNDNQRGLFAMFQATTDLLPEEVLSDE